MSRFRPEEQALYVALAMQNHQIATTAVLPLIHSLRTEEKNSLFIFSLLTFLFALARPRASDDRLINSNGTMPEWLFLFRGIRTLSDAECGTLNQSPLGSIIRATKPDEVSGDFLAPDLNAKILELEWNIRGQSEVSTSKQEFLLEAIRDLKNTYMLLSRKEYSCGESVDYALSWLYKVSDDYLTLLKEGDNAALCIFAFFCVLLNKMDYHWWMQGWGVHLVSHIYSILDYPFKLWVRWPIEEIGWVPIW
jgi:hypothetical protein